MAGVCRHLEAVGQRVFESVALAGCMWCHHGGTGEVYVCAAGEWTGVASDQPRLENGVLGSALSQPWLFLICCQPPLLLAAAM
jgi:hypothetical protein